jgi:GTP-binding protein Era
VSADVKRGGSGTAAGAGDAAFRAGFAAIVGRPNVGKSTLLNAFVGEKLSIVTPRPQTTRHRVLGLVNLPGTQIAFVDTPGLHRGARRALNRAMNRTASTALADADLVLFVVEAGKWTREDEVVLERVRASGRPVIAIVNKVDRIHPRERLLPFLQRIGALHDFLHVLPVSALRSGKLERAKQVIASALPESPQLFPADVVTDRDLKFRIAELVREKLTLELQEEVPYGIAVELEKLAEEDGQLVVSALIWVDRRGQKPIVIGARGERLKRIGRAARLELNRLLGRRLHLELWVKVREDWADSAQALKTLGLE